jgi:hypothetical protein
MSDNVGKATTVITATMVSEAKLMSEITVATMVSKTIAATLSKVTVTM